MRAAYLPAILPATLDNPSVRTCPTPLHWLDRRLRGSGAYHPFALLSFFYWGRMQFCFDDDVLVFGDSGGFQVYSQGAIIDPREVIDWQVRYCDIGAILDAPPFSDSRDKVEIGFKEGLLRTVENVKMALPRYLSARERGTAFRWYGAIHGRTGDEIAEWHGRVSDVYPFDDDGEGWAFKVRPKGSEGVARALEFIEEMGIKRAHFFAPGGPTATEVLLTMGPEAGLDLATWDNSSPIHAGANMLMHFLHDDSSGWSTIDVGTRRKGSTRT